MQWCADMHLVSELSYAQQRDRNQVMALCAIHLSQGLSISFRTIKLSTIKRCILSAAAIADAYKIFDPRLDSRGTKGPCIAKFLHEVQRWESMTNPREPVTVAMVKRMHFLCADHREDSLESDLCYWNFLGLFGGFRLSEWAQNYSYRAIPLKFADGSPVAFTFKDITFKSPNGKRLC